MNTFYHGTFLYKSINLLLVTIDSRQCTCYLKGIVLLLFSTFLNGELCAQGQSILDPNNVVLRQKTYKVDSLGTVYWSCDSLQPGELFTKYRSAAGLQADDSMHLTDTWQDSLSFLFHNAYSQYYKGIKVEHSNYTELYDGLGVCLSTGWITQGLNLPNTPSLDENDALEYLLDYIDADKYYWIDSSYLCVRDTCDTASYIPEGELVYYNAAYDKIAGNYILAWRFDVFATKPYSNKRWYVDANTGQIIDSLSNEYGSNADHWYYGTVNIDDTYYGDPGRNKFTTEANDGHDIHVKYQKLSDNNVDYGASYENSGWKYAWIPKSSSSTWGTTERDATSTLFAMTQAWDMYAQVFKHHSLTNNGGEIRVLVNRENVLAKPLFYDEGKSTTNQHHSRLDYFTVGKIGGKLPCTYDHLGHEYSHGINHYARKLINRNEPGAIGESFGDIFGVLTERFSTPGWDWIVGGDISTVFIRDLANPTTTELRNAVDPSNTTIPYYYPAIYLGSNWYFNELDEFGIHFNSSVHSKWFHLLSVGGTQNGQTCYGIGIDNAAKIAFFNFRNLVNEVEFYYDVREHSIAAATLLFGACSYEVYETCKAWKACGIGDLCVCPFVNPPIDPCRDYSMVPPMMGVNAINKQNYQVSIYPNPAKTSLTISFKEIPICKRSSGNIQIIALDGRVIIDNIPFVNTDDETTVDVNNLTSGVYFVKLISENKVVNLKFVKE